MFGIVVTVLTFVQCAPAEAFWTHQGKCWDPVIVTNVGIAQGGRSRDSRFLLETDECCSDFGLHRPLTRAVSSAINSGTSAKDEEENQCHLTNGSWYFVSFYHIYRSTFYSRYLGTLSS